MHEAWINLLPLTLPEPYSLFCNQLSVDLHRNCTVKPLWSADHTDRSVPEGTGGHYGRRVFQHKKVSFDVICLAVTAGMTIFFLGHLDGLGIGTILAAFTMGKVIGVIGKWMDGRLRFVSVLTPKTAKPC